MSGSPFWTFSLAVYGTKGVPDACIRLQDTSGVDVNVMLYLIWLARQGRQLDLGDVREIVDKVEEWRSDVVVPLRQARRSLKAPPRAFDAGPVESLRAKVKAAELEAERLQQEALFACRSAGELGVPAPSSEVAARRNLGYYGDLLGSQLDEAALQTVIEAAHKVQCT